MSKPDISQYRSFDQICDRLDGIIDQVRDKDTSLERSLDLFDEAIALGSAAVEMVDVTELTPAEEEKLAASEAAEAAETPAAPDADGVTTDAPAADEGADTSAQA